MTKAVWVINRLLNAGALVTVAVAYGFAATFLVWWSINPVEGDDGAQWAFWLMVAIMLVVPTALLVAAAVLLHRRRRVGLLLHAAGVLGVCLVAATLGFANLGAVVGAIGVPVTAIAIAAAVTGRQPAPRADRL